MKKILLSAVAFMAAMNMNAQEFCAFNADDNADFAALNLTTDYGATIPAGTVLGKTESVTCTNGADSPYKTSSIGTVTIGEASWNGGMQGDGNAKDADGGTPSSTLIVPASGGSVFKFETSKDGFLYVIHKASSNKAYTVFEEGNPIGYTFAAVGDASTALGQVYGYTLVGTREIEGIGGYLQASDLAGGQVQFAEKIALGYKDGDEWTNIAKGGLSVIKFPVYADLEYVVNANGSKMTASGFYFDTTGDATITTKVGDEEVTILEAGLVPGGGSTAIQSVKAQDKAGVRYNLAGQKVDANYKGIIIENGKKSIQK